MLGLVRQRAWLRPLGLFYAGAAATNMFFYFMQTFLGPDPPPSTAYYLAFNLPWLIAPLALGARVLLGRDLARAAGAYAQELVEVGHLDHKGGPSERLRKKGLVRRFVAENLARFEHNSGPRDYVVKYWTTGEQEFANIVSPRYIRMGFGLAASESYCYAVLILTE